MFSETKCYDGIGYTMAAFLPDGSASDVVVEVFHEEVISVAYKLSVFGMMLSSIVACCTYFFIDYSADSLALFRGTTRSWEVGSIGPYVYFFHIYLYKLIKLL